MHKIQSDIEKTKMQQKQAEKHKKEILFKKLWLENKEAQRKKVEQERRERMREKMQERHRRELMNSCEPGRVRTYQCREDGTRVIKYFKYIYDFDEHKCVEKVHKKTAPCYDSEIRSSRNSHMDEIDEEMEEYDDYEGYMPKRNFMKHHYS